MIFQCLECNVAGFINSNGHVERVPYVFLPQRGQIIYPHAEIRFEGKFPALNKNWMTMTFSLRVDGHFRTKQN